MPVPFTPAGLRLAVEEIFHRAGLATVQARPIARVIAEAEACGAKSHGIYRIEGVLRTVKAGKVDPRAEPCLVEGAILRVDARGGFSNPAFDLGLPALVERARANGMAALVIENCCHFAALWPEVEALTAQGLAGLVLCPSYATVAPIGGTRPLLGTNPLAFGWPRPGRAPYVFDFATSVAARGEIELHRRAGKPLPEGWALSAEGEPTTDPVAALSGAMLPFGGHKGSALSTMIELLAGAMIGQAMSAEALATLGTTSLTPSHGELILAFSPPAFAGGADPFAAAETLFAGIEGQGARLPSARRQAARAQSAAQGILLTEAEAQTLRRLAEGGLEAVS